MAKKLQTILSAGVFSLALATQVEAEEVAHKPLSVTITEPTYNFAEEIRDDSCKFTFGCSKTASFGYNPNKPGANILTISIPNWFNPTKANLSQKYNKAPFEE